MVFHVWYFVRFVKNHILCILGLQMKREEIRKLKAQLLDRDKVIKKMREQEAAYLAKVDSFKVSCFKMKLLK